jgi:hypothetical protein
VENEQGTVQMALLTVASNEVIIPRLERIEYTLGLPKNMYSNAKICKRIAMLEEDCGLEPDSSYKTLLQRVDFLENVIGI